MSELLPTVTHDMLLLGCLLVLVASVLLGLLRAMRGPSLEDRLMSILLLGTGGVATMLLLGKLLANHALYDVALVFALLAAVLAAAMTRREVKHD